MVEREHRRREAAGLEQEHRPGRGRGELERDARAGRAERLRGHQTEGLHLLGYRPVPHAAHQGYTHECYQCARNHYLRTGNDVISNLLYC